MIDHAHIAQCSREPRFVSIDIDHDFDVAGVRNMVVCSKVVLYLVV